MGEPLNIQPINEMAANLEVEAAMREKRKAPLEDEEDFGFQSAIKRQKVTT